MAALEQEQQEHVATEEALKTQLNLSEIESLKTQRTCTSLKTDLDAALATVESLSAHADDHHEQLTGHVTTHTEREREAAKDRHAAEETLSELRGLVKATTAEKDANMERCKELEATVASLSAGEEVEHATLTETQRKLSEALSENATLRAENEHMHDESHGHAEALAARVAETHAVQDERDQLKVAALEQERSARSATIDVKTLESRLAHEKAAATEATATLAALQAEMAQKSEKYETETKQSYLQVRSWRVSALPPFP